MHIIRMYAYTHISAYICICIYIYTCKYIYTYTCIHTDTYTCTSTNTTTSTSTSTYTNTYTWTNTYTFTCTRVTSVSASPCVWLPPSPHTRISYRMQFAPGFRCSFLELRCFFAYVVCMELVQFIMTSGVYVRARQAGRDSLGPSESSHT